jgi:hypothetical protein
MRRCKSWKLHPRHKLAGPPHQSNRFDQHALSTGTDTDTEARRVAFVLVSLGSFPFRGRGHGLHSRILNFAASQATYFDVSNDVIRMHAAND